MNYVLTTSSTADLTREELAKLNIPFTCFHFHMDGEDYRDDIGESMAFEEFYARMNNGSMPTTSQPSTGEQIEFFEPFLKEGKDVLHLAFSSGISGEYANALIAKDVLEEKYPERRVVVVDSLGASRGYGMLLTLAAEKRDEGYTLDELVTWLEANRLHIQSWVSTTNLDHLKRGGRVSATAAAFGNLLNISPIISITREGKLVPTEKVRGRKKLYPALADKMLQYAEGRENYTGRCFVSHTVSDAEIADAVAEIEKRIPNLKGKVEIGPIGTVIGAHTGPGTVALFFFGDEREI